MLFYGHLHFGSSPFYRDTEKRRSLDVAAGADVLTAGADGEPAAVAADIGQNFGGGFLVDGPDEVLIDVFLFFQAEVLHRFAVEPLHFLLGVAQVLALFVGAAGAERIGGEGEPDGGAGYLPQLVDDVVHVGNEIVAVAVAGVALGAE